MKKHLLIFLTLLSILSTYSCGSGSSGDSEDKEVNSKSKTISIIKEGTGSGKISSHDYNIDCGDTCSYKYSGEKNIILSAVPDSNSVFAGWSGDLNSDITDETCEIDTSVSKEITAKFELKADNADNSFSATLTVTKAGTGSGKVLSDDNNIDCGDTCSYEYSGEKDISLSAVPDSNSVFAGWSGDLNSDITDETCEIDTSVSKEITAKFELKADNGDNPASATLTVTKAGTGSGKVLSDDNNIDCGDTCSYKYSVEKNISLSAVPDSNSVFAGWSGDLDSDITDETCEISTSDSKKITAKFELKADNGDNPASATLTVTKAGTGSGKILSDDNNIDCGDTCSYKYSVEKNISLSAVPDSNSVFAGWSGDLEITDGTCQISTSASKEITAKFELKADNGDNPASGTLTVTKAGTGSGKVLSGDNNIDCGDTCLYQCLDEKNITLSAVPDSNSVFAGWSGDLDSGFSDKTCEIIISGSKEITARFELKKNLDKLISPERDLQYLGAFRLPNEQGTDPYAKWNGGGHGMSFNPTGDVAGASDGFIGSLFSISNIYSNHVSEFSIPQPVISANKDINDLPVATTIQTFADVTEGRQVISLTGTTLVDIQYYPAMGSQTTDKLYWTMYSYYMPHQDDLYHGWSELDFTNLNSQGVWKLGNFSSSATSRYLFDIPISWAETYTPGKYLAAGRYRVPNGGSWGPALYTFGPWNDGNPPANGSSVDAVEILKYNSENIVNNYSHSDEWNDGAWLEVNDKSAVIIAGRRGVRTRIEGLTTYGGAQPDDYSNSKGYHASPNYGAILFYDSKLLGLAANGDLNPGEIQPYCVFNVQDYLFTSNMDLPVQDIRTRGKTIGGVGYDRDNNILYFMEKDVDGYYTPGKPIVHVFKITDGTSDIDVVAPSIPNDLQIVTNQYNQVEISWNESTDNQHLTGYIIFRDNFPVDTATKTYFKDENVNPESTYNYTIKSWDYKNNISGFSSPLLVTTPAGTDSKIPLITNIHITNIGNNSAVINWNTDEPTTSKINYGAQYHVDKEVSDLTLKKNHSLTLTDLTGLPDYGSYEYRISSTDSSGNTNEYPPKFLQTAKPNANNFKPEFNSTGAKRISAGSLLSFNIEAFDLDRDDTLTFSAQNLPASALFNPDTKTFSWTPGDTDKGIHKVNFIVSDGDQEDIEEVSIVVE